VFPLVIGVLFGCYVLLWRLSLLILAFFLYVGFSAALASIAGVVLIFFTFLLDDCFVNSGDEITITSFCNHKEVNVNIFWL